MIVRIPLPKRGRAQRASSADSSAGRTAFYGHSRRERFQNPLPTPCRIAVLSPKFAERDGVRYFAEERHREIDIFGPDILAGAVPALLRLAEKVRVTRAVVAFSGARVVSDRDRDLLWNAFQAPVFEYRFGPEGEVIARECEAHDGLHLFVPERFCGEVRTEACACGRLEPRIF